MRREGVDPRLARRALRYAALTAALSAAAPAGGGVLGENVDAHASVGMLKDDNMFRRDFDVRDETRLRAQAGVEALLEIGRQSLRLDALAHDNRFENTSELDYVGSAGSLTLDWEAGRRLDGTLAYLYSDDLTSFNQLRRIEKDITTIEDARAEAGFFLTPRLQVRGDVRAVQWRHSAPAWRSSELDETHYGASLMLRTAADNFIGIGTTRIDGEYPNRFFGPGSIADNAYEQIASVLIVEWSSGGKTSFDMRVGHTSREQEHLSGRDFDAVTGGIAFEYAPSPKTTLSVAWSRDIRSIDEAVARAALVDRIDVTPSWQVSPNVLISARATYRQQDFIGLEAVPDEGRVDEELHVETQVLYSLGSRYSLEVAVGRGARDSTRRGLDYDYLYGNVGVRVTF
ncbi:MAG: outer membrane beta-barrel protein [Gammaproteobacteria bacterium]|nr:outer membrane beta-barrel protein [Gammaproteobacteria bacterium]